MQSSLEMPEPTDLQQDWVRRFLAVPELLLVVLAGPLLVQITFLIIGIDVFGNSQSIVLFMATEATFSLILIMLCLSYRGESLSKVGWVWEDISLEVGLGVVCVPVLFLFTFLVGLFFHIFAPQHVSLTNPLLDLVDEPGDLVLFLMSSVYVGGIKEEIQRAFILDRFERYLGPILLWPFLPFMNRSISGKEELGHRLGAGIGLIVWSILFAVGHAVQGVDSAAGAGVLGLLFGLLYLWRRNLIAPMVAHALFDITTLLIVWSS